MKTTIKQAVRALPLLAICLFARDIAPIELEVYTAEVYRADYNKLPQVDKDKIKQEYAEKIKLGGIVAKQLANDPLYISATEFKALDIWGAKIAAKTDTSDAKIKEIYDKQDLKVAPKYRLRNILVKDDASADAIIKELAQYKGEKLTEKFAALAIAKSQDAATKEKGGDSGWMDASVLPSPIYDEIKDKTKGSVFKLAPIKDVGVQVVYIEDYQPEHKASFDEAKPFIKQEIIGKAIAEQAQKLLNAPSTTKGKK